MRLFKTVFFILVSLLMLSGCGNNNQRGYVCAPGSQQIKNAQRQLRSLDREYSFDGFKKAWESGDDKLVRLYFKAAITDYTYDGKTLMHLAAENGWKDLIDVGIKCDMDIDVQLRQHYWTPLHLAIRNGELETAKTLIKAGADLNVGSKGVTSLHSAVRQGDLELVELLISNGADVNARDMRDRTPLDYARLLHRQKMIKILKRE
jgi:major membrane immunogen (membrane-anchored lipoprotein)